MSGGREIEADRLLRKHGNNLPWERGRGRDTWAAAIRAIVEALANPPAPSSDKPLMRQEGLGEPWTCGARKQSLPEPADCNWPVCGCDPAANKVLEALQESGSYSASDKPLMRDDAVGAFDEFEREYLLLASYCGTDTPGCSNKTPCADCLAMCNVFDGKGGAFLRELGRAPATPAAGERKPHAGERPCALCNTQGCCDCYAEPKCAACEPALSATDAGQANAAPSSGEAVADQRYAAQSKVDLHAAIAKLPADFPNYGDWPVTLPAGHWRALASPSISEEKPDAVSLAVDLVRIALKAGAGEIAMTLDRGELDGEMTGPWQVTASSLSEQSA